MASIAAPTQYSQPAGSARFMSVWPAVVLLVCFLFPPEVAFYAGPLRMGVYRLALIALSPLIVFAALNGRFKIHPLDFIIFVVACWLPISFAMNYDWSVGLEAGGSQSLDLLLSYFLGRIAIRTLQDLRNFLICIFPAIAFVGLLLAAESLSGSLFVRQTAQSIFGGTGNTGNLLRVEYRQGFLRAYSVFTHPIHAGIFLSSFIPLYFLQFKSLQWRNSGVFIGFLGFFSLSSAALLGILANVFILVYDWVQRRVRDLSWGIFLIAVVIGVFTIQLFSQSGVVPIIYRYLTFNAQTGYYRTLIWQFAGAEALRHPWFGIGYEEYTRPAWMGSGSIDAHYLFMATSYGFFPALLYFLVAFFLVIGLGRFASKSKTTISRQTFIGLASSLSVIIILLFTVTLWGAMLSWFNFTLGYCVALLTVSANLSSGTAISKQGPQPISSL